MSKLAYVVTRAFQDRFTHEHYAVGDFYLTDDADRVALLQEKGFLGSDSESVESASAAEQQPVDLDAKADGEDQNQDDPEEQIKHVGGGTYELPNGDRVKGKDAALEALAAQNKGVNPDASEGETGAKD